MRIDTFYGLPNWLVKHGNLKAGKHVSVEMKIAIFLYITTRQASQRDTVEQYGGGVKLSASM
jgi:antitoxin component of MazEF toxin-antitoxin module